MSIIGGLSNFGGSEYIWPTITAPPAVVLHEQEQFKHNIHTTINNGWCCRAHYVELLLKIKQKLQLKHYLSPSMYLLCGILQLKEIRHFYLFIYHIPPMSLSEWRHGKIPSLSGHTNSGVPILLLLLKQSKILLFPHAFLSCFKNQVK